ncbi:MAG: isoprenylcysteine carboxylmethyltransferase family protein [Xanthomonadaceae bacterium]|nr:isoprenylcysteine carboxylmethyltransferase family protein [Xanthomonadaceae bacterium]
MRILQSIELKIPPPVVALVLALGMGGVAHFAAAREPVTLVRMILAGVLALCGVVFDLSGMIAFRRARTTVNPMRPAAASAIVSHGVYAVTRNPMYAGLACLLGGWAVYLGSPWAGLGPVVLVAWLTRFQIMPEEKVLAGLFGADYAAYRAKVRRWI